MIVIEHRGKVLLKEYGIPIPRGEVASTPEEAARLAQDLGGRAVLKAQVLAGRRGKAGGIRRVRSPEEAREAATELLGRELLGQKVEGVLVEEWVEAAQELYLSFTVDAASGRSLVLFSPQGGMEVEELAQKHPTATRRFYLASPEEDKEEELLGWVEGAGMGAGCPRLAQVVLAGHRAFVGLDLLLLEINPLFLKASGELVAGDCKMELDNNALFRHPALAPQREAQLSPREREASRIGISYVEMEGDIGVIASGAGLGMATLDMLRGVMLSPANFLDTGGGITRELMEKAVRFVLEPEAVRGGLINLYGGINPMVEAAEGIIAGLEGMGGGKPIVVKLAGNQEEEAWAVLEARRIPVVKTVRTEEAADLLARLLGGAR